MKLNLPLYFFYFLFENIQSKVFQILLILIQDANLSLYYLNQSLIYGWSEQTANCPWAISFITAVTAVAVQFVTTTRGWVSKRTRGWNMLRTGVRLHGDRRACVTWSKLASPLANLLVTSERAEPRVGEAVGQSPSDPKLDIHPHMGVAPHCSNWKNNLRKSRPMATHENSIDHPSRKYMKSQFYHNFYELGSSFMSNTFLNNLSI